MIQKGRDYRLTRLTFDDGGKNGLGRSTRTVSTCISVTYDSQLAKLLFDPSDKGQNYCLSPLTCGEVGHCETTR